MRQRRRERPPTPEFWKVLGVDHWSEPTEEQRHKINRLWLAPLRLLVPAPPVTARMQLQDMRYRHPKIARIPNVELLPFYSIEQMHAAILLNVYKQRGNKRLVRFSRNLSFPLSVCLTAPRSGEAYLGYGDM